MVCNYVTFVSQVFIHLIYFTKNGRVKLKQNELI